MRNDTNFMLVVLLVVLCGCAPTAEPTTESTPEPPFVQIGEQTWLAVNLADTLYRNGDPIRLAMTSDELWAAGEEGTGAFMRQDSGMVLYNWFAVMDPRGLGPEGWHVPSNADWEQLAAALGPDSAGWHLMNSEFAATLDGFRHDTGAYEGLGTYGSWWTTDVRPDDAWYVYFRGVGTYYTHLYEGETSKYYGMSLRLIRDR